MTELFIVKTDTDNFDIPELFWELADEEKKISIKRIKSAGEQKTRLYAHVAAKTFLAEKLGVSCKEIKFSYLPSGKPYVENCPVKFNISHTENAFAVAFSDREIGVDIEKRRRAALELCNRYFSNQERDYVFKDLERFEECFFYVWTRKEAYLKYTGKGISGMKSVDTESDEIFPFLKTFVIYNCTVSLFSKDENIKKRVLTEEEYLLQIKTESKKEPTTKG